MRGNWYAQVYSTDFGWSRAHPTNRKVDVHETLSLLFKRDFVPPKMVMDESEEQTIGLFRNKFQEMDCHIKQTDPYSPWQLQTEGSIRELKKGYGRNMVRAGAPKQVWNDTLDFEAYLISHTALGIYMM